MGVLLKGALLLVALFSFALGAWIVGVLIFAYLFLAPVLGRTRKPRAQGKDGKADPPPARHLPLARIAGVLLLVLSAVAIAEGGTFSPVVFGAPGLTLLALPGAASSLESRARPIDGSILLRGSIFPLRWSAIAELKISTRDPVGAISGLNERILYLTLPSPRLFVVFSTRSLRKAGAEDSIVGRMRVVARALNPLGVYLLPMDGKDASALLSLLGRMKQPQGNVVQFASSATFGALQLEADGGVVKAFEFHPAEGRGAPALPPLRGRPSSTVFLNEILQAALRRWGAPRPDQYAAFLGSMAATEGETLGQRLTELASGGDGQALQVASLGTPKVELTRAQLQGVTRIYE